MQYSDRVYVNMTDEDVPGDEEEVGGADEADKHIDDVRIKCWRRRQENNIITAQAPLSTDVNNVGNNAGVGDIHSPRSSC